MRNGGIILAGAAIFILGLLIRSPLVEWLLNAVGLIAMIAGVIIFALGVFNAVRARR